MKSQCSYTYEADAPARRLENRRLINPTCTDVFKGVLELQLDHPSNRDSLPEFERILHQAKVHQLIALTLRLQHEFYDPSALKQFLVQSNVQSLSLVIHTNDLIVDLVLRVLDGAMDRLRHFQCFVIREGWLHRFSLPSLSNLYSLDLAFTNGRMLDCSQLFRDHTIMPHLRVLRLEQERSASLVPGGLMKFDEVHALTEFIRFHCETLVSIELIGLALADRGLRPLCAALTLCNLRELGLIHAFLTDFGIRHYLCPALERQPLFQYLQLSRNPLLIDRSYVRLRLFNCISRIEVMFKEGGLKDVARYTNWRSPIGEKMLVLLQPRCIPRIGIHCPARQVPWETFHQAIGDILGLAIPRRHHSHMDHAGRMCFLLERETNRVLEVIQPIPLGTGRIFPPPFIRREEGEESDTFIRMGQLMYKHYDDWVDDMRVFHDVCRFELNLQDMLVELDSEERGEVFVEKLQLPFIRWRQNLEELRKRLTRGNIYAGEGEDVYWG